MILDYIQIVLALLLLWPRGYVLIYLIDRSKAMSFGFKFFAGWVLGFAGFSVDLFGANVIGGQDLTLVTFLMSSVSQIFGFGFLVFLAERKILYPKFNNFFQFWRNKFHEIISLKLFAKIFLIFLVISVVVQLGYGLSVLGNVIDESNDQAQAIINQGSISVLDTVVPNSENVVAPLNNTILKLWILKSVGSSHNEYANLVSIFYYLIFIGVFYHSLSKSYDPAIRLFFTFVFSTLPFIYWSSYVTSSDILFALVLFLTIACIFNFLTTQKISFFYLSLIYLAFSLWTKGIGFVTLLPLMIFISVSLLIAKRVQPKDFTMAWFWSVVTVGGWVYFLIINKINVFDINFDILNPNTVVVLNLTLAPVLILLLAFYLQKNFVKIST